METTTPRTKDEVHEQIKADKERVRELDTAYQGQWLDPESGDGKEWAECNQRIDENERIYAQVVKREARVAELGQEPNSREDGASFHTSRPGSASKEDIFDLSTVRMSASDPRRMGQELRDRSMRMLERAKFQHPEVDQDVARERVEALIARDSDDGRFARYALATGDPAYSKAFWKWAARGDTAGMSREDMAAWERGQQAERALSLTGSAGGFAVPFTLDPTLINTSNGVVNPIRQIARVESIVTDEWRGISHAGITASYAAEATETTDNSPTLTQPTVSTEKAQAFVPFSIEIGQDWSGLQPQMAAALADARDTLEAGKFITGTGTNEPFGVAVGTTTTVAAATGLTMTLANLYALLASLPPRYRAQASFIGDLEILVRIRQFDTAGSSAAIWVDSLQNDMASRLLGKPVYEASEMPGTITNAAKILIFGDFSRYLIVDRVGLTVDVIPHLFGANQRPTGQRGLYAYWRNGAKVLDANAFRALTGTT
jgi:HK97 family phage major capsid protein